MDHYTSEKKGQAALEYLIMVSIALMMALPLIMQSQESIIKVGETSSSVNLGRTMNEIEKGVKLVHAQGKPAKTTIDVQVPEDVYSSSVGPKHIIYRMRTSSGNNTFYRIFEFNITGNLPTSPGRHTLSIEAEEKNVNITEK